MKTDKPDDLEAVRVLVERLQQFDAKDQERILRWTREKLGLPVAVQSTAGQGSTSDRREHATTPTIHPGSGTRKDIKGFVAEKNPASDNQFAAVVAYYYRFEAPEDKRKESITSQDLQEACRQAGRERLHNPAMTLNHAHSVGLLDRAAERGAYKINSVGENLVAMTLPGEGRSGVSKPGRKPTKGSTRRSARKPKANSPRRKTASRA
jgi:hypothetical protein